MDSIASWVIKFNILIVNCTSQKPFLCSFADNRQTKCNRTYRMFISIGHFYLTAAFNRYLKNYNLDNLIEMRRVLGQRTQNSSIPGVVQLLEGKNIMIQTRLCLLIGKKYYLVCEQLSRYHIYMRRLELSRFSKQRNFSLPTDSHP